MIKYGLRVKDSGIILSYETYATDTGEFGFDTRTELVEDSLLDGCPNKQWLVNTPEHAEWVRQNTTQDFCESNGYNQPINDFKAECLEVVKIEIPEPTISSIEVTLENKDISFDKLKI